MSSKNDQVLAVKGVHKSFGKQTVLDGVELKVAQGETLAVLGRSGTGKSVLLKLIIGLQKPDSGSISVGGKEVPQLSSKDLNEVRKKIGFLFQQGALYDSLTVGQNVEFPLNRHTNQSQQERQERVRKLLASVGMEKDIDKMPSELSGGMQKRVGLARALALDPDILLFDEPTSALDPITAAEIGNLIIELKQQRNRTSVVVTHDVQRAKDFADRMVLLNEGKIVIEGTFEDLQNSKEPFVVEFLREAA